jgi:hypothetical protein
VGGGNSACDIAVAVAGVAAQTSISMRSGQYIVPKFMFGRPSDRMYGKLKNLPRGLRQWVLRLGLRFVVGGYARYGLAEPDAGFLEIHPTLNTEILDRLVHGSITPRLGIEAIEGRTVRFKEGPAATFDTIIWATGYRTSFPFLADVPNPVEGVDARLYLRMLPADQRNLYYVGLIQPNGCIWTLAELQSQIVAAIIGGRLAPPANLSGLVEEEVARSRRNYKPASRHAIAVDYHDYERQLRRFLSRAGTTAAAA